MNSNFINNYFGFNRQQRNGLLMLMLLSFFLLILRLIYPYFMEPADIHVQNLPLLAEVRTDRAPATDRKHDQPEGAALFAFDPNNVSREELLRLGFTEKTATILIRFRGKGFRFQKSEDLLKVYGISQSFYEKLAPYVNIPAGTPVPPERKSVQAVTQQAREKVDINTADSITLLKLYGIGPSFAGRIIKYRNLLGGYTGIEQLKEVYGLNEEIFNKVKDHVSAGAGGIRKINLNSDDFKTVNRHPYISYELTKEIFNFRRKTPLTPANLGELVGDEALKAKLLPYLSFE